MRNIKVKTICESEFVFKEKAVIFYGKSLEVNDFVVIREFEGSNLLVCITENECFQ